MSDTITTKIVTWGHGRNVLWAGTPVDTNGVPCNTGSAIGVVYEDLHMPDRSLKVLTAGTWDETLPEHQKSGIIISNAAKKAMDDITFAVPPVTLIDADALATALADYAKTSDLASYAELTDLPGAATTAAAGIVKQAEAVADAESAPTKAEYNGLLGALRTAGIIAEAEEETEEET